jgi:hypothetical protein
MRVIGVILTSENAEIIVKKIIKALAITGSVALLFVPFAVGTPEITKKEKKPCAYCHPSVGKPDLNEAGKYYKMHRTLEGYVEKN